jgi:hypothetical protein
LSCARRERGSTRGILVLGIVAIGAGLAWLAQEALRAPCVGSSPEGRSERGEVLASPPAIPASLAGESPGGQRKSVDGTRAPRPRPPTNPPASGAPETPWTACLDRGDEERIWDCLRAHLDPHPDGSAIGKFLCRGGHDPTTSQALLLAAALDRISAEEVLPWLHQIEIACPRFLGWSVLEHAMEQQRIRDPAWHQQFLAALTPERIFDEDAGESGILLSAHFLEKGDLAVRDWIERGACGDWGGTSEQIERALGLALAVERTPEERLAFLRTVFTSESVPGDGAFGSTFVQELLSPRTISGSDSTGALEAIQAVLCEPRFRDSAAATICLRFKDEPPPGCDRATWAALRARALEIAREIGLVIPGDR